MDEGKAHFETLVVDDEPTEGVVESDDRVARSLRSGCSPSSPIAARCNAPIAPTRSSSSASTAS